MADAYIKLDYSLPKTSSISFWYHNLDIKKLILKKINIKKFYYNKINIYFENEK